jgi:hypothetical protein
MVDAGEADQTFGAIGFLSDEATGWNLDWVPDAPERPDSMVWEDCVLPARTGSAMQYVDAPVSGHSVQAQGSAAFGNQSIMLKSVVIATYAGGSSFPWTRLIPETFLKQPGSLPQTDFSARYTPHQKGHTPDLFAVSTTSEAAANALLGRVNPAGGDYSIVSGTYATAGVSGGAPGYHHATLTTGLVDVESGGA